MDDVTTRFRRDQHAADAEALDYVRGTGEAARRGELASHLAAGCARCSATIGLWQSAVEVAGRDLTYAPPDASIRQARGEFALRRPNVRRALTASLVFDSLVRPFAAGVRGASSGPRQLFYKAGRYAIRLRMQQEGSGVSLVGQVVDEELPGSFLREVTVVIFDGKESIDRTLANRLGEFAFESAPTGDLRLAIGVAGNEYLTVALPVAPVGGGKHSARGGSIGSED